MEDSTWAPGREYICVKTAITAAAGKLSLHFSGKKGEKFKTG
jgi:hypothetical protein